MSRASINGLAVGPCFLCGKTVKRGGFWMGHEGELRLCGRKRCLRQHLELMFDAIEDQPPIEIYRSNRHARLYWLTEFFASLFWKKAFLFASQRDESQEANYANKLVAASFTAVPARPAAESIEMATAERPSSRCVGTGDEPRRR